MLYKSQGTRAQKTSLYKFFFLYIETYFHASLFILYNLFYIEFQLITTFKKKFKIVDIKKVEKKCKDMQKLRAHSTN